MRMLDADAEGADWRKVAQIVLHIDSEHEPDRVKQAFEGHLARATIGFVDMLPPISGERVCKLPLSL